MMGAAVATLAGFNRRWTSLFPGAYQVVQSDLGLTYGGTMLATGTAPPVITLTGTLNAGLVPTAITVTDTLIGILGIWTGLVTYGDGTTQAFTSAATVALTGRGAGLTLNIAAGAAAGDNVWKATCSALADQSGNGKHYAQATASSQPIVTTGLNGKPGIAGDGVDDALTSSLTLPAPGTTPYYIFAVFRALSWTSNDQILGDSGNQSKLLQAGSTPAILNRIGVTGPSNAGAALNAWVICEINRTNSASDPFKLGTTTATGITGNSASGTLNIFSGAAAAFGNAELLALAFTPTLPKWTAIRAACNVMYGSGNVLT